MYVYIYRERERSNDTHRLDRQVRLARLEHAGLAEVADAADPLLLEAYDSSDMM